MNLLTAKQNQKFPFHSLGRFAAAPWITKCTWIFIVANTLLKNLGGGWGEEAREKCKGSFWFCTRESASVSEARIIGRQGSIQNTFELRSIHTANFRKGFLNANLGRREAPTPFRLPIPIFTFGGGGEIRTLGTVSDTHPFQGCRLNHSRTPPLCS